MFDFSSEAETWNQDIETVLRMLEQNFNELIKDSDYSVIRNDTEGEKMLNLMKRGVETRIGYIKPKRREHLVDFALQIEYVSRLKRSLDLPQEKELKPGRYPGWRAFRNIQYEVAVEMIQTIRTY